MSREGIVYQLQEKGILLDELVYGQASVSVYKGRFQGYSAAIKVLHLPANSDYRIFERECEALKSLTHPNILRLYGNFWVAAGSQYYYIIIVEWCDKDLIKDMKQRLQNHYIWGETELITLTRDLVSALAYMQLAGSAHRDIKPDNIFLTFERKVKLGDFGSAKQQVNLADMVTLTGTPVYLSPALRESYKSRSAKVAHNVYKSDVYSLGLTLLSLAFLRTPHELLNVNVSEATIYQLISTLSYSDYFKNLLMNMLRSDEALRCDFVQLDSYLNPQLTTAPVRNQTTSPQYSLNLRLPENIVCLFCGEAVDRFGRSAGCEIVQLYCDPAHHMFCTRKCFCAFLTQSSSRTCPKCNAEIDADTVAFYTNRDQQITIENFPSARSRPSIEYPDMSHQSIKKDMEVSSSSVRPPSSKDQCFRWQNWCGSFCHHQ